MNLRCKLFTYDVVRKLCAVGERKEGRRERLEAQNFIRSTLYDGGAQRQRQRAQTADGVPAVPSCANKMDRLPFWEVGMEGTNRRPGDQHQDEHNVTVLIQGNTR